MFRKTKSGGAQRECAIAHSRQTNGGRPPRFAIFPASVLTQNFQKHHTTVCEGGGGFGTVPMFVCPTTQTVCSWRKYIKISNLFYKWIKQFKAAWQSFCLIQLKQRLEIIKHSNHIYILNFPHCTHKVFLVIFWILSAFFYWKKSKFQESFSFFVHIPFFCWKPPPGWKLSNIYHVSPNSSKLSSC